MILNSSFEVAKGRAKGVNYSLKRVPFTTGTNPTLLLGTIVRFLWHAPGPAFPSPHRACYLRTWAVNYSEDIHHGGTLPGARQF